MTGWAKPGGIETFIVGGRMIAQSYPTATYFLHANHLHSDTQLTDQSGAVKMDLLYYPWGQIWLKAGSLLDAHFAGFQQGAQTFYNTPTRVYGNTLGRWLSPDPVAGSIPNPQSLNRYAYVGNNPTSFTDPSGLVRIPGGSGSAGGGSTGTTGGAGTSIGNRPFLSGDYGPIQPLSLGQLLGIPQVGGFGGCDFGICGGIDPGNGFAPGAIAVPVAVGACVGSGVCEAIGAGVVAGTVLFGITYGGYKIYQAGREQVHLDHIARAFCVDRNALREAIHREKKNRPKGADLTEEEIEEIARSLPKTPGCVPTRF